MRRARSWIRLALPVLCLLVIHTSAGATPPGCLKAPAIAGYNITSSGFTVECWIRVRSKPGFDPRIIECASRDRGPCESLDGGVWQMWICNLSDCLPGSVIAGIQGEGRCLEILSTTRVDDGAYHHVAATFDQAVFRLYIDGNLEAELKSPPTQCPVAGGRLTVGEALDGEIDELRIWRVSRTASEIRKSMSLEIPSGSDSLAGYWRFNGNGEDRSTFANPLQPENYILFRKGRLGSAADIINAASLR